MNNDEAIRVLEFGLDHFKLKAYDDVVARIGGKPVANEKPRSTGATYQLESEFFFDDEPNGAVRAMGSVDDGGWSVSPGDTPNSQDRGSLGALVESLP